MRTNSINETVSDLQNWMEKGGYAKGRILQFNSTTNQLIKFMDSKGLSDFNTTVGVDFLQDHYDYSPGEEPSNVNQMRLRYLGMLSEFQLHGAPLPKARRRNYVIPEIYREATEGFLSYRRFEGIVERNMSTISLYLERFFNYLTGQNLSSISQIGIRHIHGFLRFITGFSNQTKDHTMRTVRQFLKFCFKNNFHQEDLSEHVPFVHFEKRAQIPSAYSYEDVMKLLSIVDRSNPIGKRNYAILLMVARLGLRSGDVSNLRFNNIDWEQNRISLTQHKTGNPLSLPLLEDVGLAIIDYLKFGRPKCDESNIFVKHRPPISPFSSSGIYTMVSNHIGKAGLLVPNKKRGPHALRHSLASRLLEENVPLPVISEILGHANTNTTAAYLSIDIEKLRNCALEV